VIYSPLVKAITASDCRYLNREEQEKIAAYVTSIPKRLAAARQVEQKEDEIVEGCIAEQKRRYPSFASLHESAWEKSVRDMSLVLRCMVQAMMLDEVDFTAERMLYWLRSIAASTGITPKFAKEHFSHLRDMCRQKLSAEAYGFMEAHLERTIVVMSDFPEPLAPAV
jgi:hypothetical protein